MLGYRIELRLTILKLRSIVYATLVVLGIIWTGLLCVDAFVKQGFRSTQESVATIILLSSQVLITMGIPIVILLGSSESLKDSRWFNHAWFELLCLGLMLSYQFGGALIFSLLSSNFVCPGDADKQGVCQLVNVYISICSWIIPVILLFYCIYAAIRCLRLSPRYPKVWRTPFTLMPWNPNLLDLDLESKTSTSTLNKPRTGSLDEIKASISSSSSSNPSARSSTQPQSSPIASRFSSSGPSVRASMKPTVAATLSMSRFSETPLVEKHNSGSQFKHQSRQSYSQPLPPFLNVQSTSNFTFPPSTEPPANGQRLSQDKDRYRQSQLPPKHNSRLTFQQPPPLPPNPPLLTRTPIGPPRPLTLSSGQNKRVTPYFPTYYYYPPSPSTRQPARLSTLPSALAAGGVAASRTSLQRPPQSLYPDRSAVGMSRKSLHVNSVN